MSLTIGPTVIGGDVLENDYCVKEDGYGCGRIIRGFLAGNKPVWQWAVNPPIPVPPAYTGTAETEEAAKEQFKAAWAKFRANLTPKSVKHWHQIEDAARR
jgi:hypothetical protein